MIWDNKFNKFTLFTYTKFVPQLIFYIQLETETTTLMTFIWVFVSKQNIKNLKFVLQK